MKTFAPSEGERGRFTTGSLRVRHHVPAQQGRSAFDRQAMGDKMKEKIFALILAQAAPARLQGEEPGAQRQNGELALNAFLGSSALQDGFGGIGRRG